ncbi:MAG: hypothetical protein V4697_03125 [Patescibacteria group bacterium]
MNTYESTGHIRITKVPDGEAPLEVREAWVGLTLPCGPYLGFSGVGEERGVLTGESVGCPTCGRYGFSVPQDEAIAILEKAKPEAALWWKKHGFPQVDQYFGFAEREAEIVSGISRQTVIHVTDEMQGQPER